MLKLIRFLITGEWCNHDWKVALERSIEHGGSEVRGVLLCRKCFSTKKFECTW